MVDEIFWIRQHILTKEFLRESRDEEIVADLISNIVLREMRSSRNDILDEYYGYRSDPKRANELNAAILKLDAERLEARFMQAYDTIVQLLSVKNKPFANLVPGPDFQKASRYFQIIFMAIYQLLFYDDKEVLRLQDLAEALDGIGRSIRVSPGGKWSKKEKKNHINATKGILSVYFGPRRAQHAGQEAWVTRFENLLTQSLTERALFDFKQGFCTLDPIKQDFDSSSFEKICRTLVAIANFRPSCIGYVVVGVADKLGDAKQIEKLYDVKTRQFNTFHIVGVEHEQNILGRNADQFYNFT